MASFCVSGWLFSLIGIRDEPVEKKDETFADDAAPTHDQ